MSINQVNLMGYLGSDAEVRVTQKGGEIATLSLMVTDKIKDAEKGEQEIKNWWKIVLVSSSLVKALKPYLLKGRRIYVSGRLSKHHWQDKLGNNNSTTEVIIDNRGVVSFVDPLPNDTKTQE